MLVPTRIQQIGVWRRQGGSKEALMRW